MNKLYILTCLFILFAFYFFKKSEGVTFNWCEIYIPIMKLMMFSVSFHSLQFREKIKVVKLEKSGWSVTLSGPLDVLTQR